MFLFRVCPWWIVAKKWTLPSVPDTRQKFSWDKDKRELGKFSRGVLSLSIINN